MSVAIVSASFPAMSARARNGESAASSCENFTFQGLTDWETYRYDRFQIELVTGSRARTLAAPSHA